MSCVCVCRGNNLDNKIRIIKGIRITPARIRKTRLKILKYMYLC
nr:MAG TPA: hypothetical protein [Caudoviricetes sp.]